MADLSFGAMMRKRRRDRKVKVRQMARDLGVSHSYLVAIEQGKKPVSEATFIAVSAYLGLNYNDALRARGALSEKARFALKSGALVELVNLIAERDVTQLQIGGLIQHVKELIV